jgi:phosphate transport system permease protein
VTVPPTDPSDPLGALAKRFTWQRLRETIIRGLLAGCALLSIVTTIAIIVVLVSETANFFRAADAWNADWNRQVKADVERDPAAPNQTKSLPTAVEFLTTEHWEPQSPGYTYDEKGKVVTRIPKRFGIRPLVIGTLMVAGIACLIGIPIGLASAVYLSEYASARVRTTVKPTLEILAGVPTVVYGYFALMFITPALLRPMAAWFGIEVETFNAAAGGIAVGIMVIPTVSSLSEEVLRSVPRGLREAAYALGATKFDVSTKVVVPAALSGILASFLLAFARAVGETMAVTMAAGQQATGSLNPFRTTETMTAYIVNVTSGETAAGTVEYYSLYAVGAALFVITLATNMAADWILRRFREVYH